MIYVGLDDTDVVGSPGTNQLARQIVARLADRYHATLVARHQLLDDPRVPYTSKNGSASLALEPRGAITLAALAAELCRLVVDWAPPGSDPGLCLAREVPEAIRQWGRRCQRELVTQPEARRLAAECGIDLRGLGGSEGGVIGALAAVGLLAGGDDGRVIHLGSSRDDFYEVGGSHSVESLLARGIDEVRCSERPVSGGLVDVGKRLRPNLRGGRIVLFVERNGAGEPCAWRAVRVL